MKALRIPIVSLLILCLTNPLFASDLNGLARYWNELFKFRDIIGEGWASFTDHILSAYSATDPVGAAAAIQLDPSKGVNSLVGLYGWMSLYLRFRDEMRGQISDKLELDRAFIKDAERRIAEWNGNEGQFLLSAFPELDFTEVDPSLSQVTAAIENHFLRMGYEIVYHDVGDCMSLWHAPYLPRIFRRIPLK